MSTLVTYFSTESGRTAAASDRFTDEYVAASLKEADMKVAEGTMKYYTADEIRAKLEDVLNEKSNGI